VGGRYLYGCAILVLCCTSTVLCVGIDDDGGHRYGNLWMLWVELRVLLLLRHLINPPERGGRCPVGQGVSE